MRSCLSRTCLVLSLKPGWGRFGVIKNCREKSDRKNVLASANWQSRPKQWEKTWRPWVNSIELGHELWSKTGVIVEKLWEQIGRKALGRIQTTFGHCQSPPSGVTACNHLTELAEPLWHYDTMTEALASLSPPTLRSAQPAQLEQEKGWVGTLSVMATLRARARGWDQTCC